MTQNKQFRNPPRQDVHGIVLLNKPEGVSSNGILQSVRKLFNAKKAGHTGALDPFATGLLPICFGEATKVSGMLLDSDKGYRATLKLGSATDSGDKDGEVIAQANIPDLTVEKIGSVLNQFVGDVEQIPPMYSALKYQGKPLYWYARQGIEIERPARTIHIFELNLVEFNSNTIIFDVICSKGTYVRTLGEDIAKSLGTLGHLVKLHRFKSGSLTADKMLTIEQMQQQLDEQGAEGLILDIDLPLMHLQRIDLVAEQAAWLRNGGQLRLPKPSTNWVRFYNPEGVCMGVGEWLEAHQRIKPKRLFNLPELMD
jgi:tRNA pseudouridine55 synthase